MKPLRHARGEVVCDGCGKPMMKAAAVVFNRLTLHPEGCFAEALKKVRGAIAAGLRGIK